MVSVIVPNYNHAKFLEKRMSSIMGQTYQDFELIILDDCSTDASKEIIEQYRHHPQVKQIVYNDVNSGSPFAQWNKGISLARGEFIWIAESDDYADDKLLENLLPAFEDEQVGIAFCSSHWIDEKGNIGKDLSLFKNSFCKDGQEIYMKEFVKLCLVQNASSALIRKRYISSRLNKLHTFRYCGDWFFYLDVLMNSKLWYTNEKLNYFRWYHNNSSSQAVKDGKWTDEGIHVLTYLKEIKGISIWDVKNIQYHWNERIQKEVPTRSRRLKLKLLLAKYCIRASLPLVFIKLRKSIRLGVP